ncbi:acyl-CoA dehydrogenase family protein [Candidatus Laterigemmans baculatus]|uniref:acyl-CoA dehydrogenase family protein n=1 Tax=Candidatus Laterigemmans baculatus TaxID=2770505 RepID=UPI001F21DCE8|nr:acyl-CoA dehydrogenase family protein [Candidatus Laterigemmans baculatus]
MEISTFVERVDSDSMDRLCDALAAASPSLEVAPSLEEGPRAGNELPWPAEQLAWCGRAGVFRWFMPAAAGGLGWSEAEQTRAYLRLAQACQTTTFVITQRMGACRRLAQSSNQAAHRRWLEPLLRGDCFATVGISHLTTSRRHLKTPVLRAIPEGDGFRLDGYSPWVTGGTHAEMIVVGATLDDGREILAAVPTDQPGVRPQTPASLVALTASCTGRVDFEQVLVAADQLLAGPVEHVMQHGSGAGTGGLQTSTLAAGLAAAAVEFIAAEAERREDLEPIARGLGSEVSQLHADLIAASEGSDEACSPADLRGRANRLVLRATQAALTAAKGAGFVSGHPAGRWCREALFYLVWSCPQPVSQAHLCELAGIEG